jgi:hypothetical protein
LLEQKESEALSGFPADSRELGELSDQLLDRGCRHGSGNGNG